jgi:hypothetical protein
MFRRFRVLVSVSAALPVTVSGDGSDNNISFNFRGSVETANFLGHLFRTLSQVLHLTDDRAADDGLENDLARTDETSPVIQEDDAKSSQASRRKRRRRRSKGEKEAFANKEMTSTVGSRQSIKWPSLTG